MSDQYCPYCGARLPAGAVFCPNCGANVAEKPAAEIKKPIIPPTPPKPPKPVPTTGTAIAAIRDAIRRRPETDSRMSSAWILVVIFSPIMEFIGLVFIILGLIYPPAAVTGILLMLFALIISAALYYKLISRRNKHFMRSRVLREGILRYVESKAEELGETHRVSAEISTMRMVHTELNNEETEKSAGLHTFLTIIIPLFWLYVMYYLTKDFVSHDSKERAFFQTLTTAASKLDIPVQFPFWKELPKRSAGLYILLTLALGGLFSIYWMWTLIKDPHQHFDAHSMFEDTFMQTLR